MHNTSTLEQFGEHTRRGITQLVFVVYGLIHLIVTGQLEGATTWLVAVVISGLTAFLLACLLLVYRKRLRARVLDRTTDLVLRILEKFRREAK